MDELESVIHDDVFNFHHRVVETMPIISISSPIISFNFHHRVVETMLVSPKQFPNSFNFHHRVVETLSNDKIRFSRSALTFTIGWLKQCGKPANALLLSL